MTIAYITALILTTTPMVKYGLLFLLIMIEGPLVTMVAGILASQNILNFFLAYFIIVVADVASDAVYFGIGRWGNTKMADKLKAYANKATIIPQKIIQNHPGKTLLIGKLTHVAGVPVLVAAGLARVRFTTFIVYETIATLIKSMIFILIGYWVGHLTATVDQYLIYGTIVVFGILIIFIVYIVVGKYLGKKLIERNNKL